MLENELNLARLTEWRKQVIDAFVECRDIDMGDHVEIPLADWERLKEALLKAPSRTLPFIETAEKLSRPRLLAKIQPCGTHNSNKLPTMPAVGSQVDRGVRRVVCAAIRAADGSLLLGVRHYSSDMHQQIHARHDGHKFLHRHDEDQGFVDQRGQSTAFSGRHLEWCSAPSLSATVC